jgi:hypothetical protein
MCFGELKCWPPSDDGRHGLKRVKAFITKQNIVALDGIKS